MLLENEASDLDHPGYTAMRDHGLALVRAVLQGTRPRIPRRDRRPRRRRAPPVDPDPRPGSGPGRRLSRDPRQHVGFPDLIVPAGFTGYGLPVTLSFLGPAFSEPRLIALGYAFEQRTRARRLPITTPPLRGDMIDH